MTTNARKRRNAEGEGEREPCRHRHPHCSGPKQPALEATRHNGTIGEGDGGGFLGPPKPSERMTWASLREFLDKATT